MRSAIRLLYVDDDPNLLAIGKFFLETDGQFSVDIATSASAGLTILKSANYDAIISDYQMPDMDGIQFLVEVRKRFGSIPFILFTGRGREEVVIQAINNGADFYLQKGGEPEALFAELTHKIRQAMNRKRAEEEVLKKNLELNASYEQVTAAEEKLRLQLDELTEKQAALKISEEKFRAFTENITDLTTIEANGVYTYVSPSIQRISGLNPEEFVGKKIQGMESFLGIVPEDIQMLRECSRMALENPGISLPVPPFQGTSPDGSTLYMEGTITYLPDVPGISGIIFRGRDITERKKAEETLRLFKDLVEHSSDAIGMSTPEGKHYYQNEAFNRLFGNIGDCPPETVYLDKAIGKQVFDTIIGGGSWQGEVKMFKADGTILDIFTRAYSMTDLNGHIIGLVGLHTDITGRKRVEDKLRIKDTVFESSIAANSIGNNQGIITSVNPAFLHMWGYRTKEDAIGKSIASFFAHEKDAAPLLEALDTFGRWEGEFTALRADGSTFIAFGIATVIRDETGKQIGYQSTLLDITERKRTVETLKTSQIQFAEAMDLAHLVNWELDVATGIFTFDDRFYALYGTTAELEGGNQMPADMYAKKFVHPDDQYMVAEEVNKAIQATDPGFMSQVEHRIIRRDGEIRHIVVRFGITKDKNGRTIKTHGANQDITDRKRVEEALKESESRYRLIAENTADVIWTLSYKTGKFTYVSPSVQKLRGYTPDEVLNQTMAEALTTDSMEAVARLIQEGISERKSGDTSRHITTNLVDQPCKDGSVVSTEVVSTIVFDEQGHPVEIIGISRNITERKRAEEALRESHDRFEATIASLDDAVFLVDPATLLIIECNDATTRIFGYSYEELVGRETGFLHVDQAHLEQFGREARATYEDPGYYTREFQMRRKDGSVFPTEHFVRPIHDPDGRILYVVSVVRDITERKRAEEVLAGSEAKFRTLFESMAPGVFYQRADGTLIDANPAALNMFGLTREQFIGRDSYDPCWKVVSETGELLPAEQHPSMIALRSGKMVRDLVVGVYNPARDDMTWLSTNAEPQFRTGETSPYQVFVTMYDITRRKVAEDALVFSERKFAAAFQASPDPIAISEIQTGKILDINRAFVDWSGYLREEMTGKTTRDLNFWVHPEERDAFVGILNKQGYVHKKEVTFRNKKKEFRNILFSAKVLETGDKAYMLSLAEDITERKKAEEALRNNAEELHAAYEELTRQELALRTFSAYNRSLLEASLDPLVTINPDGKIADVNLSTEKVTGYSREELIGTDFTNYFTEPAKAKEGYQRVFTDGTVRDYPLSIRNRDGHITPVLYNATVYRNETGNVSGVFAAARDISEHKRAEELLKESEQRYRNLYEYSRDAIMTIEPPSWRFTSGNPATVQMFMARDEAEFISKEPWVLSPEHQPDGRDSGEKAKEMIETAIRDGIHFFEWTHRRLNGEDFHATVLLSRVELGGNVFLQATVRDVTERKRAEEALKESEERYKALVETAPDMIWQIDPDGTFRYISPQIRSIMGYEPGMLIGRNVAELIPESGRPYVAGEIARHAMLKKPFFTVEVPALHKDGRDMVINIRSSPIFDRNGDLIGLRGIARDITERKQAEEALREANKKLNLLSSITRHDINNQLTVLKGYLTILKKKQPDLSFNECFEKTALSAQRISSMIQFTKEYEKIGINATAWQDCRTLINTAAKQVPLGQVIVKNDLPAGAEVFADPLVVKVFYNLLDNAIRYGGKITTVRFSVEEHERDNLVVCEDDGEGIPVEEKEQIFDRGFGKNTGMGLFLVREILAITGITIKETGEPGKGARFEMTVPKGMWRITCKKE